VIIEHALHRMTFSSGFTGSVGLNADTEQTKQSARAARKNSIA